MPPRQKNLVVPLGETSPSLEGDVLLIGMPVLDVSHHGVPQGDAACAECDSPRPWTNPPQNGQRLTVACSVSVPRAVHRLVLLTL